LNSFIISSFYFEKNSFKMGDITSSPPFLYIIFRDVNTGLDLRKSPFPPLPKGARGTRKLSSQISIIDGVVKKLFASDGKRRNKKGTLDDQRAFFVSNEIQEGVFI